MNKSNDAAARGKNEPSVEEQISKIREDISDLAGVVASTGAARAEEVKRSATMKRDQVAQRSAETVEDLRRQLNDIEDQLSGRIRERPFSSIAIAAGVGFLVALMARR